MNTYRGVAGEWTGVADALSSDYIGQWCATLEANHDKNFADYKLSYAGERMTRGRVQLVTAETNRAGVTTTRELNRTLTFDEEDVQAGSTLIFFREFV